jgi:glycosyltransferase involved in cell wall biosynthesis
MAMLSVVIPAYNEERGIREIVERVLATRPGLEDAGIDALELIVVDDGSADRTAEIVRAMVPGEPNLRLLQHVHNGGYGAALKTGFAAAKGEWIGFLDADGTYPPEWFPRLCEVAQETDADLVIGSRMAGADSQMPRVRWLGNFLFANMLSLISARTVSDSASGMRVFKRSILPQIYPLPDGLNLTPVMSTRALHERMTIVETPIPYSERIGRSKLSVVHDGVRFAQSIVWTALCYNPVRLLGMVGLVALLVAGLIGLVLVGARLRGVQEIGSFGAFVIFSGLVLAVTGVSILALGYSFNYFVALFHKTPVRQGLFPGFLTAVRLDAYFGWMGVIALALGVGFGVASLALAVSGWTVEQLWLYYLTSACLALVGVQMIIAWVQMEVLDTLRMRERLVAEDMQGKEQTEADRIEVGALSTKPV